MALCYIPIVSQTTKNNTMPQQTTCPDCNAKLNWRYEPPYQEYRGGKVWGGNYSADCECGWEGDEKGGLENYNVQENTRGW